MDRVYFGEHTIFFNNKPEIIKGKYIKLYYRCPSIENMRLFLEKFDNMHDFGNVCLYYKDKEQLIQNFKDCFKLIEAAGGFVSNTENENLFIFRRGKWDLPKGKIDKGEDKQTAALREVTEECGINNLIIGRELQPTYHTYIHKDKRILKRTYWFEMNYTGNEKPKPQLEEDITKVEWLPKINFDVVIENTYSSILSVIVDSLEHYYNVK